MTTKEILIAARAKVAQGWLQGVSARNAVGEAVDYDAEDACAFCSSGALFAVTPSDGSMLRREARGAISAALGHPWFCRPLDLVTWNDAPGRTQVEVLAAFDKAIEACV